MVKLFQSYAVKYYLGLCSWCLHCNKIFDWNIDNLSTVQWTVSIASDVIIMCLLFQPSDRWLYWECQLQFPRRLMSSTSHTLVFKIQSIVFKRDLPLESYGSGIWHCLPLNPLGHVHVTPVSPIWLRIIRCKIYLFNLKQKHDYKWISIQSLLIYNTNNEHVNTTIKHQSLFIRVWCCNVVFSYTLGMYRIISNILISNIRSKYNQQPYSAQFRVNPRGKCAKMRNWHRTNKKTSKL